MSIQLLHASNGPWALSFLNEEIGRISNMRIRNNILIICSVIVILSIIGCGSKNNNSNAEMVGKNKKIVPVIVTTVKRADIEDRTYSKGTFYPMEEAIISPKMSGKITAILVDEGDEVKKDQVVARLDDTQFVLGEKRAKEGLLQAEAGLAQSEAGLARAEANLEKIKRDYEKMKRLQEKSSIAIQRFEDAESGYRIAEASLKEARARIRLASAQVEQARASLDLAQTQIEDTKITSPITGIITKKNMNLGEMGKPGKGIFVVEYLDVLELRADISSLLLGKLKIDMPVRLFVGGIDKPIMATITKISPSVDRRLRTVEIKVRVDNKEKRLTSGLFASVELILDRRLNVLTLPKETLVKQDSEVFVYKIIDNTAQKTQVMIGIKQERFVEVNSELMEGDIVVISGQNNLQGGEKVQVQEEER